MVSRLKAKRTTKKTYSTASQIGHGIRMGNYLKQAKDKSNVYLYAIYVLTIDVIKCVITEIASTVCLSGNK